jgi:hypothetical protein
LPFRRVREAILSIDLHFEADWAIVSMSERGESKCQNT